jgi:hypothetical protein
LLLSIKIILYLYKSWKSGKFMKKCDHFWELLPPLTEYIEDQKWKCIHCDEISTREIPILNPNEISPEVHIETLKEFTRLAKQVEEETIFCSNPHTWLDHPSYKKVSEMGQIAIPWLIERLEISWIWVHALEDITKIDPIPKEHYGCMEKVVEDWKEWFKNSRR